MKRIRFLLAALLCAALVCFSCAALADFDDVPSFSMSAPEEAVVSGTEFSLTVNAKMPGFLNIELLDNFGSYVALLGENAEVHTKENDVTLFALDDEKMLLPAGSYTLSVVLTSQWGVSSETKTASLTIQDPPVPEEEEEEEEPEKKAEEKAAEPEETEKKTVTEKTEKTTEKNTDKKAAKKTETVDTTTGGGLLGEEGLEIGVGVGDTAEQENAGFWGLTADSADADIWAALISPITTANVDEKQSAYIYDSTEDNRKSLGSVAGLSQGLNIITEREDGWVLVEAFRNEDGAFVRGYIRKNRLRTIEPNQTYGFVIDKAAQKLVVFKDGERIGSCDVSTGLATPKYLFRETPAGEFITMTRRGGMQYYGSTGFTEYAIRINNDYHLCEIPTTKKDGKDYSILADSLGTKATRGHICIAHDASSDGGINAKWIWDINKENKRIKVLIFDDKDRTEVPVGE